MHRWGILTLVSFGYGSLCCFEMHAPSFQVISPSTPTTHPPAVTGVPKAQANHAVILVKFAHECQSLLKNVTLQLADTLGEGTLDLAARIGIHSGPVTAGKRDALY